MNTPLQSRTAKELAGAPGRAEETNDILYLYPLWGGRLNRNRQHGRFFSQKGNPSRIARGYPPHGQLDGIPLMDS